MFEKNDRGVYKQSLKGVYDDFYRVFVFIGRFGECSVMVVSRIYWTKMNLPTDRPNINSFGRLSGTLIISHKAISKLDI